MRFNLILFVLVVVLVLVNRNFIEDEDEYDNEGGTCRSVAQKAKAAHPTSVIRLLSSGL